MAFSFKLFAPPPKTTDRYLKDIAAISERAADFWAKAHGWAPHEAADLLSKARLDWLASFSRTLRARVEEVEEHPDEPAVIIVVFPSSSSVIYICPPFPTKTTAQKDIWPSPAPISAIASLGFQVIRYDFDLSLLATASIFDDSFTTIFSSDSGRPMTRTRRTAMRPTGDAGSLRSLAISSHVLFAELARAEFKVC